jgi:hypothetical protein
VDANGQSLAYVYGHAGHQADMQTPSWLRATGINVLN